MSRAADIAAAMNKEMGPRFFAKTEDRGSCLVWTASVEWKDRQRVQSQ